VSYRLAKGVSSHEKNGRIVLVRALPLKTLTLHAAWKNVFDSLSGSNLVTFPELLTLIKNVDAEPLEEMLNDLVLKGFLEQEGIADLEEFPMISVIIPVHNRPEEIRECLRSVEKLDYPSNRFETIVVDDASTDHTPEIVSRFSARLIRLNKNRQAPYCRNLAAGKASGDILAFVDSDCLVDPLWLKELLPSLRAASMGAVGGRVDAYFNRSGLDRYEAANSSLIMGRHSMRSQKTDTSFYVPSCNLLVKRDVFRRIGGFREELVVGEDVDLCWRIQDQGFHVAFQPVGRVRHKHRNRLVPFCKRRFEYGTSEPLLQKLHERRGKKWVYPVTGFLFLVLGVLAATIHAPLFLALCAAITLRDTLNRWRAIHKKSLPVGVVSILVAVLRGYFAFLYHLCAFASRYYLIWGMLMFPLLPVVSTVILSMHLLACGVDFLIKKPNLNPSSFLLYFTLDQLSYQCGVWWACFKQRSFGSVNPKLIWSTFSAKV
jgi:mycofactocin system glycosyltransferase